MLTDELKALITNHSAGMVATVNADGTPSVSPKATFVILDYETLAFGNIRSPGTLANVRVRPNMEVCFIDVILRKAARISGIGDVVSQVEANRGVTAAFETAWPDYIARMTAFVLIKVQEAELILSPAYDIGTAEEDLRRVNLAKLNAL